MESLDMMGKVCPIPVIEAKKTLETLAAGAQLTVAVDNATAVENLKKLAGQRGDRVSVQTISDRRFEVIFTVAADPSAPVSAGGPADAASSADSANAAVPAAAVSAGQPGGQPVCEVAVLASETMGVGDPALGQTLMKGFVYALTQLKRRPDLVLLYNGGARLSVEGSPVLADLKQLAAMGTEILTCGTCLNFYELTDRLGVGGITNMYTIVERLSQATRIIKP